jgi:integrase
MARTSPPARTFATQAEAEEFRSGLLAAFKVGRTKPTTQPTVNRATVSGFLTDWVENTVKENRTPSTYTTYETCVRLHVIPALVPQDINDDVRDPNVARRAATFGDLLMTDLTPGLVSRMYRTLYRRGYNLGMRRHIHRCLSTACAQAIEDDVIDHNPCLGLGKKLRKRDEQYADPQPNPLSRPEAKRFLTYVEEHEREWLEFFQFLHDTGVRVGEASAVTWDYVDLVRKRVEIVASYSPAAGKDKAPKTSASKRFVDLTDLVVDQLRDLRQRQRVEGLARGLTKFVYVFTTKTGGQRRLGGTLHRTFARIIKACRLTGHTIHDLRDTFATTHLSDDYRKLPWVSAQLGHATPTTTEKHYFRYIARPDSRRFANDIR